MTLLVIRNGSKVYHIHDRALAERVLLVEASPPGPACPDPLVGAISDLAAAALRQISDSRQSHFKTLQDATHRNRRGLSSRMVKKLQELNHAHTFIRHYTQTDAQHFLEDLAGELRMLAEHPVKHTFIHYEATLTNDDN